MPELMAAVIGVLCGVAAAIPTSLLLVVLWCKRNPAWRNGIATSSRHFAHR